MSTVNRSERWNLSQLALFFVPLCLYLVFQMGMWPEFPGVNEASRAYLTLALYERGETAVDQEIERYYYHEDVATHEGQRFSNKAPGSSLWLLPAAFLIDLFSGGKGLNLISLLYFGRILMLSLPFLCFLYFFGRQIESLVGPPLAWGLMLAYILGTNAGAYAILYFGHGISAMTLMTAFLMIWKRSTGRYNSLCVGLLCGFCVLVEFSTVPLALILFIYHLMQGPRGSALLKRALGFVAGVLPMALILMAYNQVSFGNPFLNAYMIDFKTSYQQYESGLFGVGLNAPSFEAFVGLLLSPNAGLFFYSPWLLMVCLLIPVVWHLPKDLKSAVGTALAVFTVLVVVMSSYAIWHGVTGVGSRHLTVGVPFLVFLIAVALREIKTGSAVFFWAVATVIVGLVVHQAILAVFPHTPHPQHDLGANPLKWFIWPFFKEGRGTFTLANYFGMSMRASWIMLFVLWANIISGYMIPVWKRWNQAVRLNFLVACLAGIVLSFVWFQIGTVDTEDREAWRAQFANYLFEDTQIPKEGSKAYWKAFRS